MTNPSARPAAASDDPAHHLAATRFLDYDRPEVAGFARAAAAGAADPRERAARVFLRVRDDILYDPYGIALDDAGLSASRCLGRGAGFCITKAVLLAAALRAVGVPARLGFADVRNHLATDRLTRLMGTDLFVYHGYAEVWLAGRWLKATPAFNRSLCEKFRVLPLDFDGSADSVFHPFDADGRRHMEYVGERGSFADLPADEIRAAFRAAYPRLFAQAGGPGGDFAAEAARERGG